MNNVNGGFLKCWGRGNTYRLAIVDDLDPEEGMVQKIYKAFTNQIVHCFKSKVGRFPNRHPGVLGSATKAEEDAVKTERLMRRTNMRARMGRMPTRIVFSWKNAARKDQGAHQVAKDPDPNEWWLVSLAPHRTKGNWELTNRHLVCGANQRPPTGRVKT